LHVPQQSSWPSGKASGAEKKRTRQQHPDIASFCTYRKNRI